MTCRQLRLGNDVELIRDRGSHRETIGTTAEGAAGQFRPGTRDGGQGQVAAPPNSVGGACRPAKIQLRRSAHPGDRTAGSELRRINHH